ncbi:lantibiotic dehydratase [Rhabdobacter roseus]|uniref:Thiopeptide-type bacteriocin biosynthesis protein n=1 Tax=Rhabdobacter roseus TaxID=1655419 RepID=A0A840TS55_9BACT|nr:lantibiotic dehydratase [Rhabdobacter roseus]MBB5287196.1 thiopeptide-type bacteriocin biosynthesis protein [Rhabdobacter roseus]
MHVIPHPFYLLRIPTLSLADPLLPGADVDTYLRRQWASPTVREAIQVASPAFYGHLCEALRTPTVLPAKLRLAYWKYLQRMRSRPTPFGLMAGCATGTWASTSAITWSAEASHRKYLRLDAAYLERLVGYLAAQPALREQLLFYPNDSLYRLRAEYRYTEARPEADGRRYFISAVAQSTYLALVLEKAAAGATLPALSHALTDATVTYEDARAFVEELVEQQLLVDDLQPALTDADPLGTLREKLARLEGTSGLVRYLDELQKCLQTDLSEPTRYGLLQEILRNISPSLTEGASPAALVHGTLYVETPTNHLQQRVGQAICRQLRDLRGLARDKTPERIRTFCRRFRERYEGEEVPLLHALDADLGVGYGEGARSQTGRSDLVQDLDAKPAEVPPPPPVDPWKLALLGECLRRGSTCMELEKRDLEELNKKTAEGTWAASGYLMGSLLAASPEALDAGQYSFILQGAEGPSAATLLGRFCPGDARLSTLVQQSLRDEEANYPDAILAEVLHAPDDKAANILARPRLRDYEITYHARSGTDAAHTLPVSDLLVSVTADHRIRLRSRRLQREVIPRLSSAHNFSKGSFIYQFLGDLQTQRGGLALAWLWEGLEALPFLPRVTYQNLILSRAQWRIKSAALAKYPSVETPGAASGAAALRTWLYHEQQVPRYVTLAEGDNELLLDLDVDFCLEVLCSTALSSGAQAREELLLKEWLHTPEQCWLRDGHGEPYVSEIIIPWKSSAPVPAGPSPWPVATAAPRRYYPGDAWLYLKLYAGVETLEEILVAVLEPFVRQPEFGEVVEKWFFVRYTDPDPQLRLRFRVPDAARQVPFYGALKAALQPYLDAGELYRLQWDTYQPEVERYGAHTLENAETLFALDSQSTLKYLGAEAEESTPAERWSFALTSTYRWLVDFGLSPTEMAAWTTHCRDGLLAEYADPAALRKQLNHKYRLAEPDVERLLNTSPTNALLTARTRAMQPVIAEVLAVLGADLSRRNDLLASLVHMSLNRLFATDQRLHELVIYHYLSRYATSQGSRKPQVPAQGTFGDK